MSDTSMQLMEGMECTSTSTHSNITPCSSLFTCVLAHLLVCCGVCVCVCVCRVVLEPLSPTTAVSVSGAEAQPRLSPSLVEEGAERGAVPRARRERRKTWKPFKVERDEETELDDATIRRALNDTSNIVTIRPTIAWPVTASATLRDATVLPGSESWSIVQRVDDILQLFRSHCELPKPRAEEVTTEAGRHTHEATRGVTHTARHMQG